MGTFTRPWGQRSSEVNLEDRLEMQNLTFIVEDELELYVTPTGVRSRSGAKLHHP